MLFPLSQRSGPEQSTGSVTFTLGDQLLRLAEAKRGPIPIVFGLSRTRFSPRAQDEEANARDRVRRWWQFGDKRLELYRTIEPLERVLVAPLTSKTVAFALAPTDLGLCTC